MAKHWYGRCLKTSYQLARNTYQRVLNRDYWRERERVRRFYGQFVRPGDLVFDVGAHEGRMAECFEELGARVVAVEPNPALAELLSSRYRFTVVAKAIGSESGEARLHIGSDSSHSTLSEEWRRTTPGEKDWPETIVVPVTTLAELMAEHGEPAFCKIDVEGFEDAVLAGLDRPLAAVAFEFQCAAPQVAFRALARLESLGNYRYCLTPLERHEIVQEGGDQTAIVAAIERLADADPSMYGDVIAVHV